MDNVSELSEKTKIRRVRWGFIWAILAAVLWGIGYVPMQSMWCVSPIADCYGIEGMGGYMLASVIITALQAAFFALVLFVLWCVFSGKTKEYVKTFAKPKMSRWLLLAAIFGGPGGVFGATLAVGYIGADFSSAIGLLSAVAGAFIGVLFNKEILGKKAIIGIILLIIGGLIIINPMNMIDNITNPSSEDGLILGYIGGLMLAFGMGIEGFFASKVLDIADSDVGSAIRYAWEAIIWIILLLPVTGVVIGFDVLGSALVDTLTSGPFLYFIFLTSMTLGLCYVGLYKSYTLIGVGRTLSVTTLYVPISILFLSVFLGMDVGWWIIVGAAIAIAGTFTMYWEGGAIKDSLRSV